MKKRCIIYHSTYKESLGEYFAHSLNEREKEVFQMLWISYAIPMKLRSSYFELLRVGDGKYTLTIQKYVDETWSVKFSVNQNYANIAGRFTK